jgi:hypothetical protein
VALYGGKAAYGACRVVYLVPRFGIAITGKGFDPI